MYESHLIYKFRQFDDNGLRVLIDKMLYCAKPSTLNDPLDCQSDIKQIFDRIKTDPKFACASRAIKAIEQTILADNGFESNIHLAQSNSTTELGVLSLSAAIDDPLMWAHYANGHKGFAIGFGVDFKLSSILQDNLDGRFAIKADKVVYDEKPPIESAITKFLFRVAQAPRQFETDESIRVAYLNNINHTLLKSKSLHWAYEREYRIVTNEYGPFQFKPRHVTEIVFGKKTEQRDITTLKNILSGEQWKHVRYKQAEFSPDSYQMHLVDVS